MKNRGSTPLLKKISRGPTQEHPQYRANQCSGSREGVNNGILHSDI